MLKSVKAVEEKFRSSSAVVAPGGWCCCTTCWCHCHVSSAMAAAGDCDDEL